LILDLKGKHPLRQSQHVPHAESADVELLPFAQGRSAKAKQADDGVLPNPQRANREKPDKREYKQVKLAPLRNKSSLHEGRRKLEEPTDVHAGVGAVLK